MPASTTDPGGFTTTYSYDSSGTFVTGTLLPTPSSGASLSTGASYDLASGAPLNSTGLNASQTTTVNTYDALLRPTQVTLPSGGGQISNSITSPNHSTAYQTLGNGQSAYTETLLDGYGRVSRVGVFNGQVNCGGSGGPCGTGGYPSAFYQVDYCYDATGLLAFQSQRYQDAGEVAPKHCPTANTNYAGTSYVYDGLGRVTSTTTSDGGSYNATSTVSYQNRAVKKTSPNNVQRIMQYDLLSRLSSVCEITSIALQGQSPTACGSDIAGTGFLTNYSYNLVSHTTTVTQGSQTRVFQTDPAGRQTSVTEPERGTTTYSYAYNSTGLQVTRARPQANQTNASALTHTTIQYDALGRVVGISYDDGLTSTKTFNYDIAPPQSGWLGTPQNTNGQLVAATTSNYTGAEYSYDLMGRVVEMWQCAPSNCSQTINRPPLQFSYDNGGNLTYAFDGASGGIAYTRSPAGEITSITNQNYTDQTNTPNLVSQVVNSVNGPLSYNLGNGTTVADSYTVGKKTAEWLCVGSSQVQCPGGTGIFAYNVNYNGSRAVSVCDDGQCQSNGYDDFGRLTSVSDQSGNPGDPGSYTYSYDRDGNRWTQNSASGGPSPQLSFDPTTNHVQQYSYDAAGNQTGDLAHNYTYDAEGDVLQVDGGTTATYGYNALNQRVSVTNGSGTEEFLFDPFGRRASGWIASINFGNQGRIYWDGMLLANRSQDGTTYFHHSNWLGTERMRTNYQGQTATSTRSNAFGDNFTQYGSGWVTQDNAEFTGQEHDSETGTEHFQFRQLSSLEGRWMSPDPYDGSYRFGNPQSLNRYTYVGNQPFSFTDPLGLLMAPSCTNKAYEADVDGDNAETWIETSCSEGGGGNGPSGNGGGPTPGAGGRAPSKRTVVALPSCLAVGAGHIWNAVKNTFDPSPSPSSAAIDLTAVTAASASVYMQNQAAFYAATQINTKGTIGLLSPAKSSIYRSILGEAGGFKKAFGSAGDFAKIAASATLVGLDVNLGYEIYDEITNPEPCR